VLPNELICECALVLRTSIEAASIISAATATIRVILRLIEFLLRIIGS
jgi:hypothetical protein